MLITLFNYLLEIKIRCIFVPSFNGNFATVLKTKTMKTKIKGQYWINKKSKLVWCCDGIENEIIIYRNNQTKVISKKSLLKNFTKQFNN